MKTKLTAVAAIAIINMLAGCARDADGHRKGWVGQWQAMREWQDNEARNAVDPEKDGAIQESAYDRVREGRISDAPLGY